MRFSKMKKLTEAEVELLFPQKTYYDWLNGGQERDHENRDGVLQEEGQYNTNNNNNNDNVTDVEIIRVTDNGDVDNDQNKSTDLTTDDSNQNDDIEMNDLTNQTSTRVEGVRATDGQNNTTTNINNEDDVLHFTSGTCAICLEVLEDEDKVRGLVCGHVFHSECLDPWLTRRRACCPMCKRDYYYKGGENENANEENSDAMTSNDAMTTNTDARTNDNVTSTTNDDNTNQANNNESSDNNDNNNDNENSNNNAANSSDIRDDDSDLESIDIEVFRADPTLRAMLQELIPTEERVRMILSDESLSHMNFEGIGREVAKKKYGNIFKVIFWKIMGISKQDLFNYGVVSSYHQFRLEQERREFSNQPLPDLSSTAEMTDPYTTPEAEGVNSNNAENRPTSSLSRSSTASVQQQQQETQDLPEQDLGEVISSNESVHTAPAVAISNSNPNSNPNPNAGSSSNQPTVSDQTTRELTEDRV